MTEILKLTDRWNMTIYVSKADFENPRRVQLPLYTARGNRISELPKAQRTRYENELGNILYIIRENIKGTPEYDKSSKETEIYWTHVENTDKTHSDGFYSSCPVCSRLMAAAF